MAKYYLIVISVVLMGAPIAILSQECTSTLTVHCINQDSVIQIYTYFGDRIPQDAQLMIECNPQPPLRTQLEAWSLSINGFENQVIVVNTSLERYVVSGNTLFVNNVNKMDEGLYRCVYQNSAVRQACVYIYARAVFASCPYYGCTNKEPEAISVTEGENITFNSPIIYVSGGRCGFRQTVERPELKWCNNDFNCNDDQARHSDRISLSNENVFTLANALTTDTGFYEVKLEGEDPFSGGNTFIRKRFHVTVNAKETTTSLPTTRATTTATSITNDSLELVIGVPFAVLIGLVFCVSVVITVTIFLARRCKKCKENNKKTVLDHDPESAAGALVPLGSRIISGQVVTKDGSLANLCMNPTESQTEDSRLHHSGDVAEPLLHPSEYQQSKREGLRLDLSSRPAIPDLMRIVAPRTPNKWMQIGLQLGLPHCQLQALDYQYRGDSQKIFAGIFAYREKQPGDEPMTWLTVINVLRAQGIDELTLAHELETMLPSSMSSLQRSHAVLHP